ncbi:MAG: hypothetical protein J6T44_11605, partial [Prevotella sp.]|nr:hypothetical protein [Prevotella sp.]
MKQKTHYSEALAYLRDYCLRHGSPTRFAVTSRTPQCPLHFLRPSPYGDVGNVGQVFYLRVRQANAQKIA